MALRFGNLNQSFPVVRTVPKLPRPLKRWDAPWVVREILAGRDQRTYAASNEFIVGACTVSDPVERDEFGRIKVEAPPSATPAIEWAEFVGGYRAGLIEWNTARLGPKPGEPGCRAPADVLREHGFRP